MVQPACRYDQSIVAHCARAAKQPRFHPRIAHHTHPSNMAIQHGRPHTYNEAQTWILGVPISSPSKPLLNSTDLCYIDMMYAQQHTHKHSRAVHYRIPQCWPNSFILIGPIKVEEYGMWCLFSTALICNRMASQ